ncbi:MAG: TonB-dependent siderophore receptor [Acidobacteriales bacterium]|nr:TonB-dependent siderophore receptor [Terriglobales bacterium]
MRRIVVIVLAAASLISAAYSSPTPQELVTLEGTVADQTKAVVSGAKVHLLDAKGKTLRSTTTDEAGHFRIDNVASGAYQLRVDFRGLASQTQQIVVANGKAIVASFELATATVTESVTVTAEAIYSESQATTATKTNIPLRDVPQAVTVVNNEMIRSQAATSMQDVLRNVPAVSPHLGEGRRDQVLIRGFSANNDQYVDGVRDDAPYYRDLSGLERIEVMKGPAAALYGRGSAGGVINRVTKKPEFEMPTLFEIATSFGSYGAKRTSLDLDKGFTGQDLAFRLTGAWEDSATFRQGSFLDRYNLAPAVLWKPGDRTQVLVQFEYLFDHRLPDRGIPSFQGKPADVDLHTYYGYPQDDFLRNRVNAQSLSAEHRFQRFTLRNNFRHTTYDNLFSSTQPNGIAANGTVRRQQYDVKSGQENYFNQTELLSKAATFGVQHELLFGLEYGAQSRGTLRFNGVASNVDLVDPVLTQPVYSSSPATNNTFQGTVAGVYVQDQITFSPKWKATVGTRYDHYRQRLDDRNPSNVDLRRIDRAWSPRAGVVYQPTLWSAIYVSISRSFQPSGDGLSLAVNNEQLKPETTTNLEAGTKLDFFGSRLSTTLSVFRLNRSNVKTVDPNDSTKLVLSGQQRTNGVEISFSGSPLRRLEIFGGYAYLDSRVVKANDLTKGKRIGLVAPHSMNLWSTYSFANGFGFGGGVTYNDFRYAANDNAVRLPGYTRVDATVYYRKARYDVALNLRNIGNVRYIESANNNNQILPGAPVNGLLTVRLRW